jgi:hypothetical protein
LVYFRNIKLKTLTVPKHHFIETYNGVAAQRSGGTMEWRHNGVAAQTVLTSILD